MKEAKTGDLYRLQDGTQADPKDCSSGKDGILRHKNGLAVVLDADGEPLTLATEAERNVELSKAAFGDKLQGEAEAQSAVSGDERPVKETKA